MENDADNIASTTEAAKAVAQTREADGAGAGPPNVLDVPRFRARTDGGGDHYEMGDRVTRAFLIDPYERQPGDPVYRPLRIFALDPSYSTLDGATALVNVPFEPVEPGPIGAVFAVDPADDRGDIMHTVNLDDRNLLLRSGQSPSPTDPRFHQQMVYAVAMLTYSAFRSALGREIAWGFRQAAAVKPLRLTLRPYGEKDRNAYYDPDKGVVVFGYFRTREASARAPANGLIYTSLSHDVVVHEVTHALLDGLRAHFIHPSSPDVLAFHEAFADVVALLQRFSYRQVVERALGGAAGALNRALAWERSSGRSPDEETGGGARGSFRELRLLTEIAREFGLTTSGTGPLRDAATKLRYDETSPEEPHERGTILVGAVFEAFAAVYARKIRRFVRLATGGTGVLAEGEISPDLLDILAEQASKLASQFLRMCIRAIDYCPPVDVSFGEFLRAVITADHDLVPDDPWKYREAWIDAFRERGIYPPFVTALSEDALLWRKPELPIEPEPDLDFAMQRFDGDPARPASEEELLRQAHALGRMLGRAHVRAELGLLEDGSVPGRLGKPRIESIRSSRRTGPDGQIVFDLVGEVTQTLWAADENGREVQTIGGATVIFDPRGAIRYIIRKRVGHKERFEEQTQFMRSPVGLRFWSSESGRFEPVKNLFARLDGGY